MRKSNVKIKGKLRTYLYLPLLLTMLLIIINVFVYMEDTSSGVLFSGFVLLYFVIMLIAFFVVLVMNLLGSGGNKHKKRW